MKQFSFSFLFSFSKPKANYYFVSMVLLRNKINLKSMTIRQDYSLLQDFMVCPDVTLWLLHHLNGNLAFWLRKMIKVILSLFLLNQIIFSKLLILCMITLRTRNYGPTRTPQCYLFTFYLCIIYYCFVISLMRITAKYLGPEIP